MSARRTSPWAPTSVDVRVRLDVEVVQPRFPARDQEVVRGDGVDAGRVERRPADGPARRRPLDAGRLEVAARARVGLALRRARARSTRRGIPTVTTSPPNGSTRIASYSVNGPAGSTSSTRTEPPLNRAASAGRPRRGRREAEPLGDRSGRASAGRVRTVDSRPSRASRRDRHDARRLEAVGSEAGVAASPSAPPRPRRPGPRAWRP